MRTSGGVSRSCGIMCVRPDLSVMLRFVSAFRTTTEPRRRQSAVPQSRDHRDCRWHVRVSSRGREAGSATCGTLAQYRAPCSVSSHARKVASRLLLVGKDALDEADLRNFFGVGNCGDSLCVYPPDSSPSRPHTLSDVSRLDATPHGFPITVDGRTDSAAFGTMWLRRSGMGSGRHNVTTPPTDA